MNTRTPLVMIIAVSMVAHVNARELPWDDDGSLSLVPKVSGAGVLTFMDPRYMYDGIWSDSSEVPSLVLYEGQLDSSWITFSAWYVQNSYRYSLENPPDSLWTPDQLISNAIAPHLTIYRADLTTSDTTSYPWPNPHPNRGIAIADSGSWHDTVRVSASELPDLTLNHTYKYWIEADDPTPYWYRNPGLVIVHKTYSTPGDTLFWMYRNWDEAQQYPALFNRMANYFPDDTRVLRVLFWRYYEANVCDSVTVFGERLKDIWRSGRTQYVGDQISWFNMEKAIRDVDERIEDICVDGQPQPVTPLGR